MKVSYIGCLADTCIICVRGRFCFSRDHWCSPTTLFYVFLKTRFLRFFIFWRFFIFQLPNLLLY